MIAARLAIVAIIGRRIRISYFDDGNELCNGSGDGNSTFIDFRFDGISLTSGVRARFASPRRPTSAEKFFGTGNIFSERSFASITAEELRLREQVHKPAASVKYEPTRCPGSWRMTAASAAPSIASAGRHATVRKNTVRLSA